MIVFLVPGSISFSTIEVTTLNESVAPATTTGDYTCTPSIPNGQLTNSGNLVINGRLDASDSTQYRCTSDDINGSIVIELAAMSMCFKVIIFCQLI